LERDVDDTVDPDGRPNADADVDDGLVDMLLDSALSPPRATLTLRVGHAGVTTTSYLNVLIDLNQDGSWGGAQGPEAPEWVVQNLAVQHGTSAEQSLEQTFTYAHAGRVPERTWMRVALTDRPVPANWDGRGYFEAGEVEDHLVELATHGPLLTFDCKNPRSATGEWSFDGARQTRITCTVTPRHAKRGESITLEMQRQEGNARHSGLCGSVPTSTNDDRSVVQLGPLSIEQEPIRLACWYERDGNQPSQWSLQGRFGVAPSSPTLLGVRLGHSGRFTEPFRLVQGSCPMPCDSDLQCSGASVCMDGCCSEAWSAECAALEAIECGRCCAITGAVHAGSCVRQACSSEP
jgi:hypothetical protein